MTTTRFVAPDEAAFESRDGGTLVKICYVDESGLAGDEPVLVMAGVISDMHKLPKTLRQWQPRLNDLLGTIGRPELKGSEFCAGRSRIARLMGGDERTTWIDETLQWMDERKLKLALASVDKASDAQRPEELQDDWMVCGMHLALQLQAAHGRLKSNKGTTLLVTDEAKRSDELAELLLEPPAWSDDYYGRGKKDDPLKELVHTPFTVDSGHNGMIQLADLVAFLFRRYVELSRENEEYAGERVKISGWVATLSNLLLPMAARHRRRRADDASRTFTALAAAELVELGA